MQLWNVYWADQFDRFGQSLALTLSERDWLIGNVKAQGGRILGLVEC